VSDEKDVSKDPEQSTKAEAPVQETPAQKTPVQEGSAGGSSDEKEKADTDAADTDAADTDAADTDAADTDAVDAEHQAANAEKSDADSEPKDAPKSAAPRKRETWTNTLLWALGILVVLGVEMYIYGHDGDIEVCVGIDKLTDYSIRTEPRSKANASKHPFCAKRVNLGMWNNGEELAEAALKEACGAASRVVGAEHRQKCLRRDDPWSRFVEKQHIAPWDPRLYRRLLWLD
jgi:hypothetical protein